MPGVSQLKNSPWVNPVTICIVICVALFVNAGIQFGESAGTIFQQIFLPYFLDTSGGFGRRGAFAFRGVALTIQLGVIILVIARGLARENAARAALSTFGIIAVLAYFFVVAAGYLLPRLH